MVLQPNISMASYLSWVRQRSHSSDLARHEILHGRSLRDTNVAKIEDLFRGIMRDP